MPSQVKYHISEDQLAVLAEYNRIITICKIVLAFSASTLCAMIVVVIMMDTIYTIDICIRLLMAVLFLVSVLTASRLMNVKLAKRLVLERIKSTAHYSEQ